MSREDVVDITFDDACLASADVTDNKDLVEELLLNVFVTLKFGCLQ